MPKLIAWFVDNPVAANLLMFFLIMSGLLALKDVRKEEFPNIETPVVTVTVPYLGAAPAEVESGVCSRVEESIDGIEGIEKIRSTSAEGRCSVFIELGFETDRAKALDDINAKVNSISTFPREYRAPYRLSNHHAVTGDAISSAWRHRREITEIPHREYPC